MDDRYPATDEEQSVHLDIPFPDAEQDLSRWLPVVKWLLALPHYVVLFILVLAAILAVIVAWIAILFTAAVSPGALRLRGGSHEVAQPGHGICLHSGH